MSAAQYPTAGKCPVCNKDATKKCSRCKSTFYCSVEHQRSHWKIHKPTCNDTFQADQYTIHKREFDRIIEKYKLNTEEKSSAIADFLTTNKEKSDGQGEEQEKEQEKVSAAEFADKFGMTREEAVVFLGWIQVGVKFKEESIDAAKKSGLGNKT